MTESKSAVACVQRIGEGMATNGTWKLFGVMEIFCTSIVMVAIELYLFVKIQQILCLKLVNCIVCNLYLNKDDERKGDGVRERSGEE